MMCKQLGMIFYKSLKIGVVLILFMSFSYSLPLIAGNNIDVTSSSQEKGTTERNKIKKVNSEKCLQGDFACKKKKEKRSFLNLCKSSFEKCNEQHKARIQVRKKAKLKCKTDPEYCFSQEKALKKRRESLLEYIRNNS